jgi:hypothetical protein
MFGGLSQAFAEALNQLASCDFLGHSGVRCHAFEGRFQKTVQVVPLGGDNDTDTQGLNQLGHYLEVGLVNHLEFLLKMRG